jgi:hypothetical protein
MKQNKKWFKKVRGSYLPSNLKGALTYIPYIAYIVGALVYAFNSDYAFWTKVFIVIPNWVAACIAMSWFASRKS